MNPTATASTRPYRIHDAAKTVWDHMRTEGEVISRQGDAPFIVEINLRDAVNATFPQFYVKGTGGQKAALTFHSEISVYLKYSSNAVMIRRPSPTTLSRWQLAAEWDSVPDDVALNRYQHAGKHSGAGSVSPIRRVLSEAPELILPDDPDPCPPNCPGRRAWQTGETKVSGHAWQPEAGTRGYLAHVPEGSESQLPPNQSSARPCGDCGAVGSEPCANPVTGEPMTVWHSNRQAGGVAEAVAEAITSPAPVSDPDQARIMSAISELFVSKQNEVTAWRQRAEAAEAEVRRLTALHSDMADAVEIMRSVIAAWEQKQ